MSYRNRSPNKSPKSSASPPKNLKSHMTATSMMMTGNREGLEKVRKKIDSLPYENFPFCCSSDQPIGKDFDMTRKPVTIVQKIMII